SFRSQRSVATALESYYVDCNRYPPEGNPCDPTGVQGVSVRPQAQWPLIRLTTPIAYITTTEALRDPFFTNSRMYTPTTGTYSNVSHMFYGNYTDFAVTRLSDPKALKFNAWYLSSLGPDHLDSAPGWRVWHFCNGQQLNALAWGTYDPTNGTISFGDIYRCGGEVPSPALIVMGFK
ncbi:MAG: hypothetical protein M1457_04170, partial [bacterium]|nr:hypothetical protein [bacterium]